MAVSLLSNGIHSVYVSASGCEQPYYCAAVLDIVGLRSGNANVSQICGRLDNGKHAPVGKGAVVTGVPIETTAE